MPAALTRVTMTRKSAPFFKDSTCRGLRLLTVGETGVSGHLAVIANYLLIGLSPLFFSVQSNTYYVSLQFIPLKLDLC